MQQEMMITMTMNNMINTTTTTSSPTWKLYENPFYTGPQNNQENKQQQQQHQLQEQQQDQNIKQLHLLHLPVSTRKVTSSFWDLTFIKPHMDAELETAKAQILELKAQVEYERKARKKAESLSKKLSKEREGLKKVCEDFVGELAFSKSEISRLKMEMEEERKMLRVAEVLREERVQMKLSEAKIILEEKISELEVTKSRTHYKSHDQEQENSENRINDVSGNNNNKLVKLQGKKQVSLKPENHHIKRGIRGFVEFPRVVRAIGSRSRHLGTKLECQKAQLMILLKQKTQIQSSNLIMS